MQRFYFNINCLLTACFLSLQKRETRMKENSTDLTVYKASAGSGKTYSLAKEYLKLIIANPFGYANILAVTFTNKATAEMKTRIMEDLYGISNGLEEYQGLLKNIVTEMNSEQCENILDADECDSWSEEIARNNANLAMAKILHDYSFFRIETIDSFFQTILRNLAKELGHGAFMNIELDSKSVLNEAMITLFDQVANDEKLLNWISNYIDEKVRDGKSWRLEKEIAAFAENLFNEKYMRNEPELRECLKDMNALNKFRSALYEEKNQISAQIEEKAVRFFKVIKDNNLTTNDFPYNKNGVAGYFIKIVDNKNYSDSVFGVRASEAMNDSNKWTTKTHKRANEIKSLAESDLIYILKDTEEFRKKNIKILNTCASLLKQINNLGLLQVIADIVNKENDESNRFMLANTQSLLNRIMKDDDAPFIYEKIGASIKNIMIDEFQDTSRTQWDNFKPLLNEGMASKNMSLIVGDPKQSIYRWRNGDWRIINNMAYEFNQKKIMVKSLDTNWRSESEIIRFNNNIFRAAIKKLKTGNEEKDKQIADAYGDVEQKSSKKESAGYVNVKFIGEDIDVNGEKTRYEDNMIAEVVKTIDTLVYDNGMDPSLITVLTRKNDQIAAIANELITRGHKVISDEAFRLNASPAVNLIIEAMQYIVEPKDPVNIAQLLIDFQTVEGLTSERDINDIVKQVSLNKSGKIELERSESVCSLLNKLTQCAKLPLYELAEHLYELLLLKNLKGQEAYMYSFLDGINNFITTQSSDLSSFLKYWNDVLSSKTIPSSGENKGIRLYTIHKSKGLEFHTVIVPFCDWTMTTTNKTLLWCSTLGKPEPFSKIPILPIEYGQKMKDSLFADEYAEEQMQLWVDNINLLYVALTRAEKNMFILCKLEKNKNEKDKKNNDKESLVEKNISELIMNVLNSSENEYIKERWDSENLIFNTGSLCKTVEKKNKKSNNRLKITAEPEEFEFCSFRQPAKFLQSNKSKDFIGGTETNVLIEDGKVKHYLFANIKTTDDIDSAVAQLKFEGVISADEEEKYVNFVKESIERNNVEHWFSHGLKYFNECSIVYFENGELQTRRPDRVIFDGKTMTVIDFKFGNLVKKEHEDQVKEYMNLLKNMGYKNTEGYIWYFKSDNICKVEL